MSKKNEHWGTSLDDFLKEEGVLEKTKAEAITRVVAWQLAEEMKKQGMSKTRMAKLMHTSRTQIDRVLNANSNTTVETLQKAASFVGLELRLELVHA